MSTAATTGYAVHWAPTLLFYSNSACSSLVESDRGMGVYVNGAVFSEKIIP
jgi:hypothetical protein